MKYSEDENGNIIEDLRDEVDFAVCGGAVMEVDDKKVRGEDLVGICNDSDRDDGGVVDGTDNACGGVLVQDGCEGLVKDGDDLIDNDGARVDDPLDDDVLVGNNVDDLVDDDDLAGDADYVCDDHGEVPIVIKKTSKRCWY